MKKNILFTFLILMSCCKSNRESSTTKNKKKHLPIHVESGKGKKWNVFGVKITGKIMSDQTNGDYSVIITETPSKGGPPMHVHKNEDELFYILKGNYIFNCGDKKIDAKKGDLIRLPRGIPHNFVNVDSITGITMNTITPGGFEYFFENVARASEKKILKRQEIDSIANRYGIKFIRTVK